jgi:hypothetical protein
MQRLIQKIVRVLRGALALAPAPRPIPVRVEARRPNDPFTKGPRR